MVWILLVIQSLISAGGLVLLRFSMPLLVSVNRQLSFFSVGAGILGFLAYAASFLLWLFILSRNPVTFAYPITVAITLGTTVLLSWLFLGEKVSWMQLLGILLLCFAVFLVGKGAN